MNRYEINRTDWRLASAASPHASALKSRWKSCLDLVEGLALRKQQLYHLRIAERAVRGEIDAGQHDLLRHHARIIRGLHFDQRIAAGAVITKLQIGRNVARIDRAAADRQHVAQTERVGGVCLARR